jgi:hypothetical protein
MEANTTIYTPHAINLSMSRASHVEGLGTAAKSVMTAPTGDQRAIASPIVPGDPVCPKAASKIRPTTTARAAALCIG